MVYLYAVGAAFHSLGIRANARLRFPRAKTAPGGQTKPNGCIVFLVLVSCSGQRRCGTDVWGFRCVSIELAKSLTVRQMMYISIVSYPVSVLAKGVILLNRKRLRSMLCHHKPPKHLAPWHSVLEHFLLQEHCYSKIASFDVLMMLVVERTS